MFWMIVICFLEKVKVVYKDWFKLRFLTFREKYIFIPRHFKSSVHMLIAAHVAHIDTSHRLLHLCVVPLSC